MANDTTTAKIQFTTPDPLGGSRSPSPVSLAAPHQAQSEGTIDIPDATASGVDFAVPFGPVSEATMVFVKNDGNQDLEVTFEAAVASSFNLAPGCSLLIGGPAAPAAAQNTALKVTTTGIQSGAGKVAFLVVGDPEVAP